MSIKKRKIEERLKQNKIDLCLCNNHGIIKKLNKIFSLGYTPSRDNETYKCLLKNHYQATHLINCFAHSCFNLTNRQIEDYQITYEESRGFRVLPSWTTYNYEDNLNYLVKFVEATGLNIEECSLYANINHNQWKIAYFVNNKTYDFHFMLQEKDGKWSSKRGKEPDIELYKTPPETFKENYKLFGFYKITNNLTHEKG